MDGADELAADRSRSNILGNVPVRLAVMWQGSRETRHGWEVPIQVAGMDPAQGCGNVIAIISLGGHGGISSTKADVEATAAEIVRCYNTSEPTPFVRLDWGGLQTNDAGRKALDDAAAVVDFLVSDYASGHSRDVLALDRVREMIAAAIDRAREAAELDDVDAGPDDPC